VKENAIVRDEAKVYGDACVFGDCCISQRAKIYQDTEVWGYALISESAEVCGVSCIRDHASVSGHAVVRSGDVFGSAKIFNRAYLKNCLVKNNAIVRGDAHIQGPAYRYSVIIGKDAYVCTNDHIYAVSDPNVINNVLTFYRNKSGDIFVGISYSGKVITLKGLEDFVESMPESDKIFYRETIEKARKKIAI
jgi:NDP-sugar pyrophosphorylase family protein